MAKHNFFMKSATFFRANSENINIVIFPPLLFWPRVFITEKVKPKLVQKMVGHLKIVVQTTNTQKYSDQNFILS